MMTRIFILISAIVCFDSFGFQLVHAQTEAEGTSTFPKPFKPSDRSEMKPHLGLLLGFSSPEGSYNAGSEFGVDIGFQPYVPFAVGLELSHSDSLARRANQDDVRRTTALAKATYNFGGSYALIRHSYIGFGLGSTLGETDNLWVSTPLVGFDIPLRMTNVDDEPMKVVSLGAAARYMIYEGSSPDALSVAGMFKYWF